MSITILDYDIQHEIVLEYQLTNHCLLHLRADREGFSSTASSGSRQHKQRRGKTHVVVFTFINIS